MNILKKVMMFLNSFKAYSVKRVLWLFFVLAIGFTGLSFVSCSPDELIQGSTGDSDDDDDDDDDDSRSSRSDDDDDEDDGDKCKGNESCEEVCEAIYDNYSESSECMSEGDLQVGRLEKIHDLLMEDFDDSDDLERNLNQISEEEKGVELSDFEDYLAIGGTKWVNYIKKQKHTSEDATAVKTKKTGILKEILKWFVTKTAVAEVLSGADDGKEILEELLLSLLSIPAGDRTCISEASTPTASSGIIKKGLWKLDSSNLKIAYFSTSTQTGTVSLKSKYSDLYDSLSCIYTGVGASGHHNIFSVTKAKNNEALFDMAFELLNKVCGDLSNSNRPDHDVACRRAIMCWTDADSNIANASGDFIGHSFIEGQSSQLSTDDSQYNNCKASAFAEFFTN